MQWAAVTTQFDATRVPPQLCRCESEPNAGPAFNDTIQGYFPLFIKKTFQSLGVLSSFAKKNIFLTVESSPPTILRSPSKPHLHVEPDNKQWCWWCWWQGAWFQEHQKTKSRKQHTHTHTHIGEWSSSEVWDLRQLFFFMCTCYFSWEEGARWLW